MRFCSMRLRFIRKLPPETCRFNSAAPREIEGGGVQTTRQTKSQFSLRLHFPVFSSERPAHAFPASSLFLLLANLSFCPPCSLLAASLGVFLRQRVRPCVYVCARFARLVAPLGSCRPPGHISLLQHAELFKFSTSAGAGLSRDSLKFLLRASDRHEVHLLHRLEGN